MSRHTLIIFVTSATDVEYEKEQHSLNEAIAEKETMIKDLRAEKEELASETVRVTQEKNQHLDSILAKKNKQLAAVNEELKLLKEKEANMMIQQEAKALQHKSE